MPISITVIRRITFPRLSKPFVFIVCIAFSLLASCDMFADVDEPPVNSSQAPVTQTVTTADGSVITLTKNGDRILSKVLAVSPSVSVIESKAYMDKGLTKVSIPYSVKSIEEDAFAHNHLESVSIPPSVKSISKRAFRNNRLTSIEILGKTVSIGKDAFSENSDLKDVSINQEVLDERNSLFAFDNFYQIHFKDPNGEKPIKPSGMKVEKSTSLDGSVVETVKGSFGDVIQKSLTVSSKLTVIPEGAYRGMGLTHVKMHPGITRIEDYAFADNRLSEVVIPEKTVFVGSNAFSKVPLKKIILSQDIRNRTYFNALIVHFSYSNGKLHRVPVIFENHEGDEISRHNYIEEIKQKDGSILEIHRDPNNPYIGLGENVLARILKVSPEVLHIAENTYSRKNLTGVVISSSVVSIGENAFSHNRLKRLIIPKSVKRIEKDAFSNNALESVDTSRSMVEFIGEQAFFANKLTSIQIPASLKNMEKHAFSSNPLKRVSISEGVTEIPEWAFAWHTLESLVIPPTVKSVGNNAFRGSPGSYFGDKGEKSLVDQRSGLGSIIISNGVESIGDEAFIFNKLARLVIPPSVTSIGVGAFKHGKLRSLEFDARDEENPVKIDRIGKHAFWDNALESLEIPPFVRTIGEFAFAHNKLKTIVIGEQVESIEGFAFADNSDLSSVELHNGLTSIGKWAFSGTNLSSIIIPETVDSIGIGAFPDSLKTVVIEEELLYGDSSKRAFPSTGVTYYSDKVGGTEIPAPTWADSISD